MRVLFLANAASIHTVRWVNAISERGHEVHLVYKFDDVPKANTISEKVILHRLKYSGTKGYFFNAMQLKKLSHNIKPDVANAHYASGYGTLARLAKLKPLVLSVWGSDVYEFPYQSKFKMKILLNNLRYASIIASTSTSMAEQVKLLLKDETKKIYITPFGVDLSQYSKNNNNERNTDKIVIGNVKSLKEVYGMEYLIRAIDFLVKTDEEDLSKKLDVRIYGDGPLRDELENLTRVLNLQDIITFKGLIPNSDVPKALEEMDIFCASSIQESFGVSLVEAMAMGLPVVATDVSGFREVIDHEKTGIIVENKNPEKIAYALKKLIFNRELRRELGKNGRNRVEELYNWENNVTKMLVIYERLSK